MDSQVRDLAERYLKNARPSGATDIRATCPFHTGSRSTDRTFCISTRTGAWICFHAKCGASGSLVQLLKMLGMSGSLVDRFIQKAKKRHVLSDKLQRKATINEDWDTVPEYVLGAYGGVPENLLDAGFTEETLKLFEVGIDRTNDRVVFPIRDHIGRLVALSGRAASGSTFPKYKVYDARPPDSRTNQRAGELYGIVENGYQPNNRRHMYGIQLVYPERYHRWKDEDIQPLVITEGYKSTLWLHQCGFMHGLGLQGSSMTAAQQRSLSRVKGPYYIMLDFEPGKQWPPDKFGRCSAIKIAKQLRQAGEVYLCRYPENSPPGTQPDDLTPEGIQAAINSAEIPSKFIMREINGAR
jgi:hypothetical protein